LSYYINIHIKQDFRDWFKKKYKLILKFIRVKSKKYIYNIDKKGCYLVCFVKENIVILIRIKKIYVKVLKNWLFVTIIKSISVNSKAISSLVIMFDKNIIMS
jgi:hypothetical protein